jgi:phage terminase large subunit GpA-like protein
MELIVEMDVVCPHCGESFPLQIDTSQGNQSVIEDCAVCCQPITIRIDCRPGSVLKIKEER